MALTVDTPTSVPKTSAPKLASPSNNSKNKSSDSSAKQEYKHGDDWTRIDDNEYELRKRLPPRLPTKKEDLYITRRTNFKAQEQRCEKMLDNGYPEIHLHGLGMAVNRTINLALHLKRRGLGSLDTEVVTGSIELTDDLLPLVDDLDPKSRSRFTSSIHIRIFRPETPVHDY